MIWNYQQDWQGFFFTLTSRFVPLLRNDSGYKLLVNEVESGNILSA